MRQGLKITNKERKQVEKALKSLDRRFAAGQVEKRMYDFERGKLLANLSRPRFNETNLAKDPKAYWKRNEINHSPAPVGFWNQVQATQNRKASQNKIHASMISFCDNGYWNTDNFQEAIKTSATNSLAEKNERSFFEETVMASNGFGATMSAEEAWNQVSTSPQVKHALERLSNTIDTTMKMFMRQGVDEASAMATVRAEAIRSGRAMTSAGYDPKDAQMIVKAIMCGEMSMSQAVNHVTSNINETAKAVANSANNNVSNDSSTMNTTTEPGRRGQYVVMNNYDIHSISPKGGASSLQLEERLANLQNEYDMTNNPAKRNELSFAIDALQKELNRREAGIRSVALETPETNVSTTNIPSQGGYDPRNNLKANQSLMQQTVSAMASGPNLTTVVKDIFTVQSNIYFDWTAGGLIEFLNNGTYRNASNSSNASAVYPSGEWTIFANVNSVPTLQMIGQSLQYATASPLWSDSDRAYLEYLKTVVTSKIVELESGVMNNSANTNAAVNNSNSVNNSATVQNGVEQLMFHKGYRVMFYDEFGARYVKIVGLDGVMVYRQSLDSLHQQGADPYDIGMYATWIDQEIASGSLGNQSGGVY
ncbi:MAG: hypothetical protein CME55_00010 [Halieaceae bacterium]|nr:hypothetical protein [Halieaceae bacterium]